MISRTVYLVNYVDYPKSVLEKARLDNTSAKIVRKSKEMDVYVAAIGEKIIGTATLNANKVEAVYVNPRYHGQGVGKKLMEKMESIARKKGFSEIILYSSITATGFYQRIGYTKIKRVLDGPYGDNTLYKKNLM